MAIVQKLIGYQDGRPMYKSVDTASGQQLPGVTYGAGGSGVTDQARIAAANKTYNSWAANAGAGQAGSVGARPVSRPGAVEGCTPRSWTDPDTGQIRYNTNAPGGRSGGGIDPNWKPPSIQVDKATRTINVNGDVLGYTPLEKPYKNSVYNESEFDAYAHRIGVAKVLPRPGSGCGVESGQLYNKEYNRIMNELGGPLNEPAPIYGTGSTKESRKKYNEPVSNPTGWTKSKTRNAQGNFDWVQDPTGGGNSNKAFGLGNINTQLSGNKNRSNNQSMDFGFGGYNFGGQSKSRRKNSSFDNVFF